MSTAGFDNICLAFDGMLIWTIQPAAKCAELEMGERLFHCFHKDKIIGVKDWADVKHQGMKSDYLTFASSELGLK
ncbi:hypothetical protein ACHAW6_009128 [Cyclotella cf. meneghiniana]